jgi:hypothetical protein
MGTRCAPRAFEGKNTGGEVPQWHMPSTVGQKDPVPLETITKVAAHCDAPFYRKGDGHVL